MAKKKASSPKKPSRKAATPTRSTTSSTTAKTAKKQLRTKAIPTAPETADELVKPPVLTANFLRKAISHALLTDEQQFGYITLLSKGAPPAAVCAQLDILLSNVIWTIEHDPQFAAMIEQVHELLSQNVAAALYRSAMEGSASAQQFYLKNRPPAQWSPAVETEELSPSDMSYDELIDRFQTETLALLDELAKENPPAA